MGEEYDMDVAEPGVRLVNRKARVVQDAGARRVLEQDGSIPRAELALVTTERRYTNDAGLFLGSDD
jgi:hypothetical protein